MRLNSQLQLLIIQFKLYQSESGEMKAMLKNVASLGAILSLACIGTAVANLPTIAQEITQTIQCQSGEGFNSTLAVSSGFRAVIYDAGVKTYEGTPYQE